MKALRWMAVGSAFVIAFGAAAALPAGEPEGVALIGPELAAWQGVGGGMDAWSVRGGVLTCDGSRGKDHAKWIATKETYGDFDLRLEFRASEGGNSGVFFRAPLEGNPAKQGLEVQLFDNDAPTYAAKPRDVWTGAIWNVAPPAKDVHKKAGIWQTLRVLCVGPYAAVWHNGVQVVSVRLDDYPDLLEKLPGLARREGRIGLQNHGTPFAFRNVRIRRIDGPKAYPAAPTPDDGRRLNVPPIGFAALFNGKDLSGWQMRGNTAEHWTARDGILHYDGGDGHLRSEADFGNVILYADWKIEKGGDSGIFLRGRPQVQIWDAGRHKEGSGGLWNNKKTGVGRDPLVPADNPVGEWNTFRIHLVGRKVTVHLNGKLVVDAAPMETLRKGEGTIEQGPIVLQHHGHPLWFRNVFVKRLGTESAKP
jgi:hypothetical protein